MSVTAPDLKAFLLATPFFGGLTDAGLDLLMSMLVECRVDTGVTVVTEGEPGRSMFIVKSGRLAVSKRARADSVIPISILEPGDFFGEMTLIEMQNRFATVVAEAPTVLYELTAQDLYACYKADIHAYVIVLQNINRELCRRLRRADERYARRQALTSEQAEMQQTIFHICSPARWEAAKSSEYRSPSFDNEGFIHCSTSDQVIEVANYLFRGQRGLVLLVINPDRVTSPIRYEDAGNGKLYPHIYGPLNPSAVIAVEPFEPSANGTFELSRRFT